MENSNKRSTSSHLRDVMDRPLSVYVLYVIRTVRRGLDTLCSEKQSTGWWTGSMVCG